MLRRIVVVTLTIALVFTMTAGAAFGCTTVVIGKDRTVDGSVLFAHSEELDGGDVHHLVYVPRGYHEPGAEWVGLNPPDFDPSFNFGPTVIDQVPMTYSFIAATLYDKTWYPGDYTSGVNEMQVTIGNNMTNSKDQNPRDNWALVEGGLIWTEYTQLVLERASTAREGVEIIGKYHEQCHLSGDPGTMYLIADPNEGWVIELAVNGQWIAKRIPESSYYVLPNCYTIGAETDLDSPDVLHSPDVVDYAVAKGYYNPAGGATFSFKDAYGTVSNQASSSNSQRIAEVSKMIEAGPVDTEKMMEIMRTCYEGTDLYRENANGSPLSNSGVRTVSRLTTEAGSVVQLRSDVPKEIGTTIWWALSTAKTNFYVPYYLGAKEFPEPYQTGVPRVRNEDPEIQRATSAYWRCRDLAQRVHATFRNSFPIVKAALDEFEQGAFDRQAAVEAEALKIYNKSGAEAASSFLNAYSNGLAMTAFNNTGDLIKKLNNQMPLSVDVSASVEKLSGNQNGLTIHIHEVYFNGDEYDFTETFKINNNAADTYSVGSHQVYVDTKGNTQIREICIVE
ncbi:MAG: C69 family dipeptidase [Clostridiales bacterium]|nr:C69 family dipeptidase [Clostridiales bacterium]